MQLNSPNQPILLEFVAEQTDHTTQVKLGGLYDSDDVDFTFSAPPADVQLFENAFTTDGGQWWINDTSHAPSGVGTDVLTGFDPPRITITPHVLAVFGIQFRAVHSVATLRSIAERFESRLMSHPQLGVFGHRAWS